MKQLVSVSVALALASLPAIAIAQVTQTYSYDANGHLTGVTTTGSAGTNIVAYVYDDADNRTSRSQTGTAAYAAILQLPADEALWPDEALVSPDGRFSLALRTSGRLELWAGDEPVQMSFPGTASVFNLTEDGRARFVPPRGEAPSVGASLALAEDGSLLLFDNTGSAVWRSSAPLDGETCQ